jgi:hypothetical protein
MHKGLNYHLIDSVSQMIGTFTKKPEVSFEKLCVLEPLWQEKKELQRLRRHKVKKIEVKPHSML